MIGISAGSLHTCAVLSTGAVKCWGEGADGRLGNNHARDEDSNVPVDVAGVTGAIQVAAGAEFTCVLLSTGAIKCWGEGSAGDLGNGANNDSKTAVDVTGISNAVEMTTGASHACALLSSGGVKCWGNGSNGRLGQGSSTDPRNTPVSVVSSTTGTPTAVNFGTSWHTSSCFKSSSAATYSCDLD